MPDTYVDVGDIATFPASSMVTTKHLNCEGLNCPMPIVELTKAARELHAGDCLEVTATDLAFKPDLEAWARRMKHTIVRFEVRDSVQSATVILGGTI